MNRLKLAVCLAILVGGCQGGDLSTSTIFVAANDYTFMVEARGVLEPSESTVVRMPQNVRMQFNIFWLIPEYSEVSEGDVVARFDGGDIEVQQQAQFVQLAVNRRIADNSARANQVEESRLSHEIVRVDAETYIAETFANLPPEYFSRNEIIDAVGDVKYLGAESNYYAWMTQTHEQRTDAQRAEFQATSDSIQRQIDVSTAAINMMELKSPTNGTFIYAETGWGQKLAAGSTIFPGRAVGIIPVRGKVKAKLNVPEVDSIGIKPGQPVNMWLDSAIGQEFTGSVAGVAPVARTVSMEDPRRYVVVEVVIDDIDVELMRVGSNLTANIITADLNDAIAIPRQVVFVDDQESFVYVVKGGKSSRRVVETGVESPTLIEVVDGLVSGERISLSEPENTTS